MLQLCYNKKSNCGKESLSRTEREMDKEKARQLEEVLGVRVRLVSVSPQAWAGRGGGDSPEPGDVAEFDRGCWLLVERNETGLRVLEIGKRLSPVESRLIRWAFLQRTDDVSPSTESEALAIRLGEWIEARLEKDELHAPLPGEWADRLNGGVIPMLLSYEHGGADTGQILNVARSFLSDLSDDTIIVPLRQAEWLILAPDRLLVEMETFDPEEEDPDGVREELVSLAEGLQQAITGEWGGDCHVAVTEPVQPREELAAAAAMLRETMELGRRFHPERRVHLPWRIHLEWLIGHLPEPALRRIAGRMHGAMEPFADPETAAMLELFFSLDCNVSETARRMYIHRNTLLYRLEKFKLESGLDVRSFNDAVRARILLLLYKMTKRK